MTRSVTYVEIDIGFCANVYGEPPCTAAVGTTGEKKCFNVFSTCQDTANYVEEGKTLRYTVATEALGLSPIDAIPSLVSVQHSPGRVRVAEDLGERASVNVTLEDHRHSDLDLDPYLSSRTYDPLTQGTYWGRFVARNKFLVGRALRVYYGTAGQELADMEVRHYAIEAIIGPDLTGRVQIKAKDPLRLADGDQAQAPPASTGLLSAAITDSATSLTLTPAGIGATEYDGVTYVAINDEICEVSSRSGDDLTIVRGKLGTEASAHDADDTVQVVLEYSAQAPNLILSDLLTTYANVPSSYIDAAVWAENDTLYVGRNYAGYVSEPTPVRQLISELLEQVGASMWWEETTQQIRYEPLRVISNPPVIDSDLILADSLNVRAQPEMRVSQVWTYYGQINPLEPQDEPRNYRAVAVTIDSTAETENEYGRPAIKKLYSRWVSSTARTAAQEINAKLLSRRRDPPRRFSFALGRYTEDAIRVGEAASLRAWPLQDDEGVEIGVPVYITSLGASYSRLEFEAQEFTFSDIAGPGGGASGGGGNNPVRGIDIVTDTFNAHVRSDYDTNYPHPDDLLKTIESVDDSTDTFTLTAHGYNDDARIVFFGIDLPGGITEGTTYYVINGTDDTFEVSASEGGSAVNLSDAGSGTQQVRFVIDVPVVIGPSVIVGSSLSTSPAMNVGSWPDGIAITLTIRSGAYIVGKGGDGGDSTSGNGQFGQAGGTGLLTRYPITVTNSGTIAGGGGGGGAGGSGSIEGGSQVAFGGGGGGGAGAVIGQGGSFRGTDGTLTTAGTGGDGDDEFSITGGDGGDGGGLGSAGASGGTGTAQGVDSFAGTGGSGGAAGTAIDGDSYVTLSGAGVVTGPQIN